MPAIPILKSLSLVSLLVFVGAATLNAADEAAPDFERQVAPLLTKYCVGCHNDADRDGDLSLESFASLQQGTPDGPAVLAGDSAGSRIIRVLSGEVEPQMPPEDEPRPSDEDIALLKAWIDAGATGAAGAAPDRTLLIVPAIAPYLDARPVSAIDWSADGQFIAIGRYGTVTVHRAPTGSATDWDSPVLTLDDLPGKVTAVHFSADGRRLVTASGVAGRVGRATIWNLEDGAPLLEITGHNDILYDAELSPLGDVLATCGYDRAIMLWNAQTGDALRTLAGHNGAVYDVAFSPDGTALASASADDTCKVWRVADGERLDTLGQPMKEQYAVCFSPDGKSIVAGGADNRIRVWKFVSRQKPRINPLRVARFGHEGPIARLAFSPDGSRLVSLAEDRTIKVWETARYTELALLENQPSVAMALAVSGTGDSFVVGRLDGSVESFPIAATHQGAHAEAHAVSSRLVTDAAAVVEVAEQEPNNAPGAATPIAVPARVSGTIAAVATSDSSAAPRGEGSGPDVDFFRFSAHAGEEWVVEVDAAKSGSKLDSIVEILDSHGERVERVLLQAVRDSYFTLRGKNADVTDDFRLFNWEEMDLNEYLFANGEVVKLWLYPRGPDSGFMVYPGDGKRWGWFDTTPLAHALNEPCYIVEPFALDAEIVPNGLPVFTLYYENDDDPRREQGADSRLSFTAPTDGEYLLTIRDVRGFEGDDFKYTVTVRPRRPDFAVTLHGADPAVGAGSAKEFHVAAKRIDNFDGPIRIDLSGVPDGFHVTTPLVIEAGQLEAYGVLTADPDAAAPTADHAKTNLVTATAEIAGQQVSHPVNNLGEIKLAEKPKLLASIRPAEQGLQPVGVSPEGWPEYVIEPGQTVMLDVQIERNGHDDEVAFGKEGAGRNLPFGSYVDNVGLNGLLILSGQTRREFFITAAPWLPETTRTLHLNTKVDGGQATWPVVLHVRREASAAAEAAAAR